MGLLILFRSLRKIVKEAVSSKFANLPQLNPSLGRFLYGYCLIPPKQYF